MLSILPVHVLSRSYVATSLQGKQQQQQIDFSNTLYFSSVHKCKVWRNKYLCRKCLHINEEITYRKILMCSKITYCSWMVFMKLCCELGIGLEI